MNLKRYRLLALLTCIGMFLVLIAGVMVTNTESEAGCGTDWPLCNGKLVPAYTLESMVEYSHRLISGAVGLLVGAAFLVTVLWKPAKRKESIWYASSALYFTVLQAALGALAVMWPQSDAILALHFGISLFAFTSTWLLYSFASRLAASEGMEHGPSGRGLAPIPRSVFWSAVAAIVYCYVVIYLGAYIRHTGSGGACAGWPLCNGEAFPAMEGAVGVAFVHRLAALVMLIVVIALVFFVRRKSGTGSEPAKLAGHAFWLVVLQIASGGLLAFTMDNPDVYVFTALLHTMIIAALFSVLCLLALRSRAKNGK